MPAYFTVYPLGNADTNLTRFANNDLMVVDYADRRDPNDRYDKRIDLAEALKGELEDADRDSFRVAVFTHLDEDHVDGAGDFFWFEHTSAKQSSDRVKMDELWVPAAALTEKKLQDDARSIWKEARYRLKNGRGIKVFSRPQALAGLLAEWGLTVEDREDCFVDAGQTVPGFDLDGDEQAEFFVHSPFAWRQDDGLVDRNQNAIVMQMTLRDGGEDSHILLGADIEHETLSEIVRTSRKYGNSDRLEWDVLKLFHHCSYLALSSEKGDDVTEPVEDVKWLFEELARQKEIIISPSWPIPAKGSAEDDDKQPPHRQAANYYKRIIKDSDGQFIVTMESPTTAKPKPTKLKVTSTGVAVVLAGAPTSSGAATSESSRAG
ncbi:conserved hypothetical protein [Aurantimonas manganoxydans SI85-9A1]|uniref:Metallo-beta-lactamase domain-containing protein n=1 Tax=Aurantimonas manganoxydans (strain ATCC BAA-1229 / DSM 21871 / SI85-9A1) TaxID=287752 RepID=Q1YJS6_AURMS|nr:hypothetical protein [Aurantimonas manganoxydans]EAS50797.1 conserved hypothetical protein [Aurantimonas manganoxydans SI85-9A1]